MKNLYNRDTACFYRVWHASSYTHKNPVFYEYYKVALKEKTTFKEKGEEKKKTIVSRQKTS